MIRMNCFVMTSIIVSYQYITLKNYFVLVCNVGYFKREGSCVLCPGNTIKTKVGNAENCDEDAPCDGVRTTPNENHTACGKFECAMSLLQLTMIYN